MEDSQENDYSFLGNDTFPNLYDALVYERKFKSEYLERQIYERLLKSEPSIVKFIENQSEHLSKRTLYHLKNVLQGDLDVPVNRAEFMGPGKFHVVVLVYFITLPLTFISQLNPALTFVDFFTLSGTAFTTSFLISLSLDSIKRVWFSVHVK